MNNENFSNKKLKIKFVYIYIYTYIYIYILKTACLAYLAKASDTQAVGHGSSLVRTIN